MYSILALIWLTFLVLISFHFFPLVIVIKAQSTMWVLFFFILSVYWYFCSRWDIVDWKMWIWFKFTNDCVNITIDGRCYSICKINYMHVVYRFHLRFNHFNQLHECFFMWYWGKLFQLLCFGDKIWSFHKLWNIILAIKQTYTYTKTRDMDVNQYNSKGVVNMSIWHF